MSNRPSIDCLSTKTFYPLPAILSPIKSVLSPMKTLAWLTAWLMYASTAYASSVRNDVDYQYFRDFAENKGQFVIGETNVDIYNKQGEKVGKMLEDIPMPDLAVVGANGVATLVDEQYLLSVAHNGGYASMRFGASGTDNHTDNPYYDYKLVDNNNYPKPSDDIKNDKQKLAEFQKQYPGNWDYHLPRLNKMVTEVAPIPTLEGVSTSELVKNPDRYTFARAGSGTQRAESVKGSDVQSISSAYAYLTGGVPVEITGDRKDWLDAGGHLFGNRHGALVTLGLPGDSGSGILVYDKEQKVWKIAGTLNFLADRGKGIYSNTWSIARSDYNKQMMNDDIGVTLDVNNQAIVISPKQAGKAQLSYQENGKTVNQELDVFNSESPARIKQIDAQLNHGKTLVINGNNNTLRLTDNLNQGAGALRFAQNATVTADNPDHTWVGAGVVVAKDKSVDWQIKNPKNDRLSKLGKGTLVVGGTGINQGDISVGDGTVVLNQKADNKNQKQAFNSVGIVSGRGTVVVGDNAQMDWDKLYFGFRGGRLDVNGQDIAFNRIANMDEGAQIVNHHDNKATVSIAGNRAMTPDEIKWGKWSQAGGDIYEYVNNWRDNRKDYFLLKGRAGAFYPVDQNSNDHWEFIGSGEEGKQKAIARVLAKKNAQNQHTAFNGFLGENDQTHGKNSKLDVAFNPHIDNAYLLLSGGSDLDGTLSAHKNGTLVLSGRPTPHAYDHQNRQEVIKDNDWQNRQFNAKTFKAQDNSKLIVSRNVSGVTGDFELSNQATAKLGFSQNDSECVRSDRTGLTTCAIKNLDNSIFDTLPTTSITGNVAMTDNAHLQLGSKAHLTGSVKASDQSHMTMDTGSFWTLIEDSQIPSLNLDNANIVLNDGYDAGKNDNYHELTVSNLLGRGTFYYLTDIAGKKADHVSADNATGDFLLNVKDTGAEPTHADRLSLLTVKKADNLQVRLANDGQVVDKGAYQYRLIDDDGDYRLYNPKMEEKIKAEAEKAEQARIEAERQKYRQADIISRHSNAGLIENTLHQTLLSQNADALTRHLTDTSIRRVWATSEHELGKHHSDLHRGYDAKSTLVQVGIDTPISPNAIFGVALSHANAQADFERGTNKADLNALSAYAKYHLPQGFVAVDTAIAHSNSELDFNGQSQTLKRTSTQLGATVGADLVLSDVFVKPYIGARVYHTPSLSYTLDNAKIYHPTTNRYDRFVGVRLGKAMQVGAVTIEPSLNSSLRQGGGNKPMSVNGYAFDQDTPVVWTNELGLTARTGQVMAQLSLMRTDGKDADHTKAGVKLSYTW
ncbi:S6 family peptidase [Moraxella nonliquefaciens]|uniref:S6 family peptidase n=1 Tax=Moraxella nonliquefaciens TaxID=478 RepID=UPI001EF509E6|nr:S6 family peptidase [Moraxella nonliquefaciens]MCG7411723.1 autotransporter domain-containing protein [Moraxella nonliquefaciens]